MNSMKRLSVYLEEGINQMVGDIPRPLFINKIKSSYVENKSKLALGCSTNCLRIYIWYVKQGNNRKADAIVYSWRMEVDSYNNVLFYTANDDGSKRTLSALSYLSRGYDMVQVYNKMSDYNDKELWSANKPSWDTVYQTPKEKYISMLITDECGEED
jgi:hypothetical protein